MTKKIRKVQLYMTENDCYNELWKVVGTKNRFFCRHVFGKFKTWYYVCDPLGYCELDHPADDIEFIVTDTGCGIPAEKVNVIFEHFEKLDHYSPGLGLGLYVGRLIARALGGDIQLDMLYTDGARFVFTVSNHIEQEDDEDIMQEQLQEITA